MDKKSNLSLILTFNFKAKESLIKLKSLKFYIFTPFG